MGQPSRDRPPVIMAYCGCNKSATSPTLSASSAILTFDEFDICCWNIAVLPPLVSEVTLSAEFKRTFCDAIGFAVRWPTERE